MGTALYKGNLLEVFFDVEEVFCLCLNNDFGQFSCGFLNWNMVFKTSCTEDYSC